MTSLKRSTTLPPPVIVSNVYTAHSHACTPKSVQVQTRINGFAHEKTCVVATYGDRECSRKKIQARTILEQFSLHGVE